MKPILYSYFRSSCSWRVRIALAWKNIDYDYKPVNLIKEGGEQHTDSYVSLNPSQLVPSFVVDGAQLTESLSILEYLEETYPDPPLLPKAAIDRAKVRAIALQIACQIQPIQNLRVLQFVGDEKKVEWAKHWIIEGFKSLEAMLLSSAGKYCFGDQITLADCCLAPQVYNAARFNVDLSKFPTISRINEALMELDAFKKSSPSSQPDTPENLKA